MWAKNIAAAIIILGLIFGATRVLAANIDDWLQPQKPIMTKQEKQLAAHEISQEAMISLLAFALLRFTLVGSRKKL